MTISINDLLSHLTSEISRAFERMEDAYPNNRKFDLSCSYRFVSQDPYIFVEFKDTAGRGYTGFSKRCPRDKSDMKRGISIAVFRAVRDRSMDRGDVFDVGTPFFEVFE